MSLTVNGADILSPTSFEVTPFRIERRDRVASGAMVIDVIAVKHTYQLGYYALDGDELVFWTGLYNAGTTFTFTYPLNGSTQSKTVWISDIAKKMILESPEVWQDVTISMEEI
jgi:hypothetical protein